MSLWLIQMHRWAGIGRGRAAGAGRAVTLGWVTVTPLAPEWLARLPELVAALRKLAARRPEGS